MPFIIDPQPNEELYLQREFRGSHDHVFAMAVSNQAMFVSVQKMVLKRDPWYFKRIPLEDVQEVRLIKQRSVYVLMIGLLIILFGGLLSVLMMWRAFNPMPGVPYHVSGWPFAIFVGGIIIPFIARGRKILRIRTRQGKFKWKPQLALDKKTREYCSQMQHELIEACKKVGIATIVSP
jgi:hypothetical protein